MSEKLPPIPDFYERHPLFVLFMVYSSMMLAAYLARAHWFASILPGSESYYHLSITKHVLSHGLVSTEDFLGFPRPVFITPFYFITANISYFVSAFHMAQVLPVVLGYVTLFSAWYLLKAIGLRRRLRFFMILFLILSPVYVYLSLVYSPLGFSMMLLVLGSFLVLSHNKVFEYLGFVLHLLLALSGPIETIASAFTLFALAIHRPGKDKLLTFAGFASLAVFFVRMGIFISSYGYPVLRTGDFMTRTFTILGADLGFGFFMIFIGLGGIAATWKRKGKFWIVYLLVLLLIISSYVGISTANVFLTLIFAGFGGFFVNRYVTRDWSLGFIKGLTIWLIICGSLFSGVLALSTVVQSDPSPDMVEGFSKLGDLCAPRDTILSDPSRGYWIESIAGCTPVSDPRANETRVNDTMVMLNSKDLDTVRELLDRYEVKYIFVDWGMKQGLVWEDDSEGILFLFRNNETFKNTIKYPSMEIWEVIS